MIIPKYPYVKAFLDVFMGSNRDENQMKMMIFSKYPYFSMKSDRKHLT
jgi:hypothetical protein